MRALIILSPILAALLTAAGDDDWKFDIVYLRDGRTLQGLVVEQTERQVRFWYVSRKPGSSTYVTSVTWKRAEIDRVELLADSDRERLVNRLQALDPSGKNEAERMAQLRLEAINWGKELPVKAQRY